jgi:hypothetical protein
MEKKRSQIRDRPSSNWMQKAVIEFLFSSVGGMNLSLSLLYAARTKLSILCTDRKREKRISQEIEIDIWVCP